MSFLERIKREPLVCFGAIATMLIQRGFELSLPLGQWSLEHPYDIQWLTRQYLRAGCEVVASAGSQSCKWKLEKWGLSKAVRQMNEKVTRIVKKVTPEGCYVAATILPSGKMLKPLGEIEPEELYDAYREEVIGYAEGGADVLWIMTMMDLEEALIALKAAKDFSDLPTIVSMSFDYTPEGGRTLMGVDPRRAATDLARAGADVVGHNCGGATPEEASLILGEMSTVTDRPLVSKPNAGKPDLVDGKPCWPYSPDEYAAQVPKWLAAGARIMGGCCGTTPDHAAKISAAVKRRERCGNISF